tara:strand:+ start:302 stop:565 length:264 start_codon:yes stop_codon:yes gene_type:complete
MKYRILNNDSFGGAYTMEFLENNIGNIVNGEIVGDWILTDASCDSSLIVPTFKDGAWIEGANADEIAEHIDTMRRIEEIENPKKVNK